MTCLFFLPLAIANCTPLVPFVPFVPFVAPLLLCP